MFSLDDLLQELHDRTTSKFKREPEVVVKDKGLDVDRLPVDKNEWHQLTDVVAVVFDMKDSTKLDEARHPASTASIYDAGVGGVVRIFKDVEADFIDVQGDGGFALFWGDSRYERAIVSAVTIRSFSDDFANLLTKKWPKAPTTAFKVAIASGPVLAKRVGLPRHLDFQEPVWAGKAVNFGFKAAQQIEPGFVLVTASVWDKLSKNDFVAFSCDCGTPSPLWKAHVIDRISEAEALGAILESKWCTTHGSEHLEAILEGKTLRETVDGSAPRLSSEHEREAFAVALAGRDKLRNGLRQRLVESRQR